MSPSERKKRIIELVKSLGECSVEALVDEFGVSDMTVRRDLRALADEGRVIRTHGGAAAAERITFEFNYLNRSRSMNAEKQAIARQAASLISPGSSVILGAGTTTLVRHVTHAWSTDPFDPLMERARGALAAAGCQVRPDKWQLGRLGMGTAGSLLVNDYGVPTVGYGPGHEDQAHAVNEYVELDRLHEAVDGTAAIAHALVGYPVYGWTSDDI